MIDIVELTISCMRHRATYTRLKVKYSKKETLHHTTLEGEETSILAVDTEDKEKVWVEAEDK